MRRGTFGNPCQQRLLPHAPLPPFASGVILSDPRIAIVGAGRLGTVLAATLRQRGATVAGPTRRGEAVPAADVVLLAIPERELAGAAAALPIGPIVGHCSASAALDVLSPHERLGLHPLFPVGRAASVTGGDTFVGAACAIDASSAHARATATGIATMLGMRPVLVTASLRPLYHAAASMAANYLVTLESAAEQLAHAAGITRAELAPLARASLESWIAGGFCDAISGPVSRGDDAIVDGQRRAIEQHDPSLLPAFDALTSATRRAMRGCA